MEKFYWALLPVFNSRPYTKPPRVWAIIAALILSACGFSDSAWAAAGNLDTTFNTTGIVVTATGLSDAAYYATLQADGKIVCAGNSFLARYNSNGRLDTTFNTTGKVSMSDGARTVIIQKGDNKILTVGTDGGNGYGYFALSRFNTNGTPDITFGKSGLVKTTLPPAYICAANSVAIQSDGQIVIAGTNTNSSGPDIVFNIARYNKLDGTLDTTFYPDGINQYYHYSGAVLTPIGSSDDEANSVAIQADGKIVAAGFSYNGTQKVFALVRYTPDASLDTTFNPSGSNGPFPGAVTTAIGTVDDEIRSIVIQPNGKIVAAGISNNGTHNVFALARYNTDGSLDTGFGSNGIVTTMIGPLDDEVNSIAMQPDGKIVAAGFTKVELTGPAPFYQANYAQAIRFALIRYRANGTPDTSFGINGLITTDIGAWDMGSGVIGSWTKATSVIIQPDCKIIATGYAQTGGGLQVPLALAMARYRNDRVTYNGNGNTEGFAPSDSTKYTTGAEVTVSSNSHNLTKNGYVFSGWNTAANGSGISYPADGTGSFTLTSADVTLYAQWTASNLQPWMPLLLLE